MVPVDGRLRAESTLIELYLKGNQLWFVSGMAVSLFPHIGCIRIISMLGPSPAAMEMQILLPEFFNAGVLGS